MHYSIECRITDVQEVLEELCRGELVEVRVIGARGKIHSGYFNDYSAAKDVTETFKQKDFEGVYFTLNTIHPGCFNRAPNIMVESPKRTTSQQDVIGPRWLLIDIDPIRPAGVSATDDEIESAYGVLQEVRESLSDCDYREAFSGNGYHLLIDCRLSEKEDYLSMKSFVDELNRLHGDHQTKIDSSVCDLQRITKLYGTESRKGYPTSDRPWRRSYLVR